MVAALWHEFPRNKIPAPLVKDEECPFSILFEAGI